VVRQKNEKLGVLDINFIASESADSLECYERTVEIIEKNKESFDEMTIIHQIAY
jgi:hypothetical protein